MCCFSGTVRHVEGTQIFVRALDAVRQCIVYEMRLQADAPVAMVLPLPIAGVVDFINLEKYPEFFKDLERAFPVPAARSFGPPQPQALAVQRVGSFVASFVPTPADFARLDPRFRLPPGVFDKLTMYRDYGFAVFQLHDPNAKIHPMAFAFPRRNPRELFFPTVHVHDGEVHDKAHFDHALYLQLDEPVFPPELQIPGGDALQKAGWWPSWIAAGKVMDSSRAQGLIDPAAPIRVQRIFGEHANADVLLAV